MAKKKGSSSSNGSGGAAPVCNCEHPYNCECGHRPPRPSKGHKWDAESKTWGGKGHKQKGSGVGQAAVVAKKDQVITTVVGQTTLLPHQRLPSKILADYCQKQERPGPVYHEVKKGGQHHGNSNSNAFLYRLIVKETVATKEDLHFVPAAAVPNQEQAKEEAALLGLLHFTPALPHERILPEPYRTTWLHAVQAQKQQNASSGTNKSGNKKAPPSSSKSTSATTDATTANTTSAVAQPSTGLRSAVAVNTKTRQAERQRLQAARNARIQKHEAIRLANQPHPVFMSAKLRNAIQRILRHEEEDKNNDQDEAEEEDEAYYQNSMQSDVQDYVEERLHNEGFTRKQAREAFGQVSSSSSAETDWEHVYEIALQWLLVHVNEEDLPASFDPRGRTLDVIAGTSSSGNTTNAAAVVDPTILQFAQTHGLSPADAATICQGNKENAHVALWETACQLAQVQKPAVAAADVEPSLFHDEVQALEAIFVEECHISRAENGITTIQLPLDEILHMHVTIHTEQYPQTWPLCVAVKSDKKWTRGLSLLVEIAKFLSTGVALGEPMLFAIHGHVMELVQTLDELPTVSLEPDASKKKPASKQATSLTNKDKASTTTTAAAVSSKPPSRRPPPQKRPRERLPFWSIPPAQTPAAVPFPAGAMKHARSVLPAAKARTDFLQALRRADDGSHVVLCTGETGKFCLP